MIRNGSENEKALGKDRYIGNMYVPASQRGTSFLEFRSRTELFRIVFA